MEPAKVAEGGPEPAAAGVAAAGEPGLLDAARLLWQELRELAHDGLTLAAIEARLAGRSLVTMIAAGIMVAILLVSAWLGLMGAAVLGLIAIGVPAAAAMLLAVAANLLLAAILYGVIRRKSRHLQFPATLRSLRPLPVSLQASETP